MPKVTSLGGVASASKDEWKRIHQRSCQRRAEILTAGKQIRTKAKATKTKDTRSCLGQMNIERQWLRLHYFSFTFSFLLSLPISPFIDCS